eukprot:GFUD01020137.1.p1 GENE.GFUD01020137.1~~GFUD01020137.1.p1  ORF type:complete len:145 (-),score=30.73 GFUD01020137.1:216-602(-)
MVKITIKKPLPDQIRSESEETEGDSEASEAESGSSKNSNLTKSGKPKRKCVLELQKAKSSKSAKPRSKSVSPEYYETRAPKKLFTCETCSKAFHSNFVLKVHLKAHRKIEDSEGKCDKYYHYYYNTVN